MNSLVSLVLCDTPSIRTPLRFLSYSEKQIDPLEYFCDILCDSSCTMPFIDLQFQYLQAEPEAPSLSCDISCMQTSLSNLI